MQKIAEIKRIHWHSLLIEMDIKHDSKKAWNLIKRPDSDPKKFHNTRIVTANQVAHQLLLNGKTNKDNSKGKKKNYSRINKKKRNHNHQY
jgi:hypothetical protein